MEKLRGYHKRISRAVEDIPKKLRGISAATVMGLAALGCIPNKNIDHPHVSKAANDAESSSANYWGVSLPPRDVIETTLRQALGPQSAGDKNYYVSNERTHNLARERYNQSMNEPFSLPEFSGLDSVQDLIDPSEFQEHLIEFLQTLPKPFLTRNQLESISFEKIKPCKFPYPSENFSGEVTPLGQFHRKSLRIEIDSQSIIDNENSFLDVFATIIHETAHSADAISSGKLTRAQAQELSYIIIKIIEDPHRPKISYPESIESQNPVEKNDVIDGKSVEFFAELLRIALNTPGSGLADWETRLIKTLEEYFEASHDMASTIAKVVIKYLNIIDPEYKPWEAQANRTVVMLKVARKINMSFARKSVEKCPDEDMKKVLQKALDLRQEAFKPEQIEFQSDFLASDGVDFSKFREKYDFSFLEADFHARPKENIFYNNIRLAVYRLLKTRASYWDLTKNGDSAVVKDLNLPTVQQDYFEFVNRASRITYDSNMDFLAHALKSLETIAPERRDKAKANAIKFMEEVLIHPVVKKKD